MKRHTNALIKETSPYLQQHAHNPVPWYPWNEESLALAKKENKPILLSIGYSACHWCHVMAHESFENEYIAKIMNTHFINIKVDRKGMHRKKLMWNHLILSEQNWNRHMMQSMGASAKRLNSRNSPVLRA